MNKEETVRDAETLNAIAMLKICKPRRAREECYNQKPSETDKAFNLAINALEKQLNDSWIPVKERLPNKDEHILLFLKNDKGEIAQVVGYLYGSKDKKFDGEFSTFDSSKIPSFLIKDYVIAWQPLPEPYREDIDERN